MALYKLQLASNRKKCENPHGGLRLLCDISVSRNLILLAVSSLF